jgi:predicted XRE-type DNA-binding protein
MENEIWKDIIINGKITNYMVSNMGNILRKEHTQPVWNRYQHANRTYPEKIIKQANDKDGYKLINIGISRRVHRLVAQAFLSNPNNLPQVNHKNGIKSDNRVENLEWVSMSGNTRHAYDTSLMKGPIGKKNGNVKITKEIAIEIINLIRDGNMLDIEIAKKFKLTQTHVSAIKNGKTWSRVTGVPYRGRMKIFQNKILDETNQIKE